jgi:hypothetical protein
MNDRTRRIEELRDNVGELRPVLAEGSNAEGYLTLFDEFVPECELGLALHSVCDYLLEPGTPPAAAETINRIQALHAAMEIEDDCMERLMAKNPA